ncbi:aldehyde dehydrogenase family protein [Sinorhizobium meliloti]|nr:aldehyde dehydrogenase family protein [Sinorhizobium meliloti]
MQVGFYDDFAERLAAKVRKMKVGNGFEPGADTGPLISQKALARFQEHVSDAVAKGRECGLFFEPTVLTGGRWR